MMHIARSETWSTLLYQEATNPFISTCPHDCNTCNTAVGDPHLRAVQYERTTITSSGGAHTTRVTSRIRFSKSKTPDHLALSHRWQPALLLLFRTKRQDRKHGYEPWTDSNERKPLSPASNSWQARP